MAPPTFHLSESSLYTIPFRLTTTTASSSMENDAVNEKSGSFQLRISELERQVSDKDQTIDELNETAGAFKLLNEKQVAEINAKDLLLARKNERIEELLEQLRDRDQQLQLRDSVNEKLRLKIHELEGEIQDFKKQLEKEEEEFSMLSAAMATKETQLGKKQEELISLKEVETQLRKDVDRLQVQLRKLEKHVDDLHPETVDACLSPRSFSENQLIQLRDDAINAKTKEIWILSGKNDQLRLQLDELEAELERVQAGYVTKENDVARRDRKIEKLESEIEALEVSRQQVEGRERAIEIATTQNTKLLQALQALEEQAEQLKNRLESTESECVQLRLTHRQHLERAAVSEVEVLHKSKEAEHKSTMLSTLQDKLVRERKALHEELAEQRMRAQLEVEKLQSELVMRRNKQYELTLRLQDVEAKLHHASDEHERIHEEFVVTRMRMEEAERVLHDALEWKRGLEDELASCRNNCEQLKRDYERQLSGSHAELVTLRGQISELKETMFKTLDDVKKQDFRILELKRSLEAKENLIAEQKERIMRLVHEATKSGQARAELELELKTLMAQLDKMKLQMGDSLRECMEQHRSIEDKWKGAQDKLKSQEKETANEQRGKSKLVKLFVQTYGLAANHRATSSCLDLRHCWLADQDIESIFTLLESNPTLRITLTRVDLRNNRLTHESVRIIVRYLQRCLESSPSVLSGTGLRCVREMDLRRNYISIEGMRVIANTLERFASTDLSKQPVFDKVLVVNDGRIECYPDASVSGNDIPLLTVDVTENADPGSLLSTTIANQKQPPRRRRENVQRFASPADPVLQEIYGLDLVSALMGESKQTNGIAVSSRWCKKNVERSPMGSSNSQIGSFLIQTSSSSLIDLATTDSPQLIPSLRTIPAPVTRDDARSPSLNASGSLPRL